MLNQNNRERGGRGGGRSQVREKELGPTVSQASTQLSHRPVSLLGAIIQGWLRHRNKTFFFLDVLKYNF